MQIVFLTGDLLLLYFYIFRSDAFTISTASFGVVVEAAIWLGVCKSWPSPAKLVLYEVTDSFLNILYIITIICFGLKVGILLLGPISTLQHVTY